MSRKTKNTTEEIDVARGMYDLRDRMRKEKNILERAKLRRLFRKKRPQGFNQ